MRILGRVLVAVIVIAALYLVLDFSGRIWAESYVAGQVQRSLQLSGSPDVTFGGALFLPELVSGKLSSARVKATDFTANGVRFTGVTLDLHDVRFSPGKLLFHEDSTIVAGSGQGTASMTDQQVTDAFQAQGVPVTVHFTTDGNVRVGASRFPVAVQVNTAIHNGKLVLRPTAFNGISFTLDLPQVVRGMTYRSISFSGNIGVLTFGLRHAAFPVAPSAK